MNQTNKKKETIMEQINIMFTKAQTEFQLIIETVWAIGTSIASAGIL